MKLFTLFFAAILCSGSLHALEPAEAQNRKVRDCGFIDQIPYGVAAWSTSPLVKEPGSGESRFVSYNTASAEELVLDATTERDVTKVSGAATRSTTFWTAWNEKGWYLYIEAEEPLVGKLVDSLIDPKSPGGNETYEIFFAPGLHEVPYYQMIVNPYRNTVKFVDWGMTHRYYRSLESFAKVESLPLEKGVGTFVFIPWEALYERIPANGDYWRFTVVRWMPYGKAGGVSWGGKVHETGSFGLLRFQPPTAQQKEKTELRVLRAAWFKFQAQSKAATASWSDEKVGDPAFYNEVLKPEIDRQAAAGEALGTPDTWDSQTLEKGRSLRDDWMEFNLKVSELRTEYLANRHFARHD